MCSVTLCRSLVIVQMGDSGSSGRVDLAPGRSDCSLACYCEAHVLTSGHYRFLTDIYGGVIM